MLIPITMPALSPTMKDGVIASWTATIGQEIEAGDVLCEIITDKATIEFESIEEGFLREIFVTEGQKADVNQVIALFSESLDEDISSFSIETTKIDESEDTLESQDVSTAVASAPVTTQNFMTFAPVPSRKVSIQASSGQRASPLARSRAKKEGLDLSTVRGSGPDGRILVDDLKLAKSKPIYAATKDVDLSVLGAWSESELTPMRQAIATRLQASKSSIPHFSITDDVNCDNLVNLRGQLKALGKKYTFNDFVMRAVALALREHPEINAGFNSQDNKIIHFHSVDISIAISIDEGLITPIIFHADTKSMDDLSFESKSLALKARGFKLKPEEFQGGSFTISNLGMFGVESFYPVINPPQAAILGVGGIKKVPVIKDGQLVAGNVMKFTLAADHRVVDGADGAKFLNTLKLLLENPAGLL
jgi:pyruvate dehydrogenase E2 component (dihydrolipoamide acetyltransferase)